MNIKRNSTYIFILDSDALILLTAIFLGGGGGGGGLNRASDYRSDAWGGQLVELLPGGSFCAL